MLYREFLEKCTTLSELMEKFNTNHPARNRALINHYIDQNLIVINDILSLSISQIRKLNTWGSSNDITCTQAKFTHEMSERLSMASKQFLDASLNNVMDYNERLKAHCDLATD